MKVVASVESTIKAAVSLKKAMKQAAKRSIGISTRKDTLVRTTTSNALIRGDDGRDDNGTSEKTSLDDKSNADEISHEKPEYHAAFPDRAMQVSIRVWVRVRVKVKVKVKVKDRVRVGIRMRVRVRVRLRLRLRIG